MNLADALDAASDDLSLEVHEAMYADPFWMERFGERGAQFSRQDGRHHVHYLAQALRFDKPSIMIEYALWLRGVLTTRGMCTLHLDEALDDLADAIDKRGLEGAAAARRVLEAAREALIYPNGDARAIQEASPAIASDIVKTAAGDLGSAASLGVDDAAHILSYAADAVAQENDRVFLDHLAWLGPYYEGLGVERPQLDALLQAIGSAGGPPALNRLVGLARAAEAEPAADGPQAGEPGGIAP
jgi:hypothetical protein